MWHKSLPSTAWTAILWETSPNLPPTRQEHFLGQADTTANPLEDVVHLGLFRRNLGKRERNYDAGEGLARPKFRIHLCPIETPHKAFNSAFQVFSVKEEQWDSSSQMEGGATPRSSPHGRCCTNGDSDCCREMLWGRKSEHTKLKYFKVFLANKGWNTLKAWGNSKQYFLELFVERSRMISHPLPASG